MEVTVEQFARMRGVSVGLVRWMTKPHERRRVNKGYVVELPEVFCSVRRYAALLGCDQGAVIYRLKRGVLKLNETGQLGVHESDLRWGLHYLDGVHSPDGGDDHYEPVDKDDEAAEFTCFLQMIERELIRRGHLPAEGLIEAQLACVARSPEWWRRQRVSEGRRSAQSVRKVAPRSEAADRVLHDPVSSQRGETKANGRPRNPVIARIMAEEHCSLPTAYRILAKRQTGAVAP